MGKLYKTTIRGKTIYVGDINENMYVRKVKWQHVHKDESTSELGWTIDKDTCIQHIFPKCSYIIIRCTDKQSLYMVSVHQFMQKARELRDRYFLKLEEWKQEKDNVAFKKVSVVEVT